MTEERTRPSAASRVWRVAAPRAVGRTMWLWISIVVVLGPAAGAQAGPVTDQLKVDLTRVFRVIEETGGVPSQREAAITVEARRSAIRSAADPAFDWREMASRSLARHWQPRTEAERAEFVQLFGDLIQRSYITQLERYSGEPIRYVGERVEGDLGVVSTRFVTKQSQEIPVDYRLLSRDGRWRVYDVVVEGVSLVGSYRSQFDKVIRTSSYPELVKRLKDKEAATR
jgi:phospholipid transport system substrate-binding protein